MASESRLVAARAVASFIEDALAAGGLPAADAAKVAGLMTEADLTGADGHGVFRLPQYLRRLEAGGFNKRPNITVKKSGPSTALVDGDNGMGHLVMSRTAETAIELARETGVAWVGARGSNHSGTGGLYVSMPAEHGMIAIYSCVANANHMAVWGGTDHLLGTNPISIAVPSSRGPEVLDMATTVVAYGTIKKYALQGLDFPEGWLISSKTGEPLTDHKRSKEGLLMPIGAYKGSGLAIMLGLLAGVLNGAAFGREVVDFNADDTSVTNTGHVIIVVDVNRFLPLDAFKTAVDRHLQDLRHSNRLPGVERIRLSGDIRRECREDRVRNGIPIPPALEAELDKLAADLGIVRLAGR